MNNRLIWVLLGILMFGSCNRDEANIKEYIIKGYWQITSMSYKGKDISKCMDGLSLIVEDKHCRLPGIYTKCLKAKGVKIINGNYITADWDFKIADSSSMESYVLDIYSRNQAFDGTYILKFTREKFTGEYGEQKKLWMEMQSKDTYIAAFKVN